MWSGLFLDVQLRNPNKTVVEVEEIIKQKYDTPKKLGMAIKKIASYIQQKKDAKYSTDLDTYMNQMNEIQEALNNIIFNHINQIINNIHNE